MVKVPSDIEIAQACKLKPIAQVADEVGLLPEELDLHGSFKAKVHLNVRDRLADRRQGKWVHYRLSEDEAFIRFLLLSVLERARGEAFEQDRQRLGQYLKAKQTPVSLNV